MLSVITVDQISKWNDIVRSFKDYDVNYLNEYARAFQLNGEGEPLLFYYEENCTRAINVVMKTLLYIRALRITYLPTLGMIYQHHMDMEASG